MRVLFCNKFHFGFGGTEVYLFQLQSLLESRGHETAMFAMAHPMNRPSPYERFFVSEVDFRAPGMSLPRKVRLAARMLYSVEARRKLRALLKEFRPDIAHIRGIYHQLSPSILWELRGAGIPILYHLNDYKVICPSYNLIAHGRPCERCRGGRFFGVVRERCHSPSLSSSLVLAGEAYLHRWLGTYRNCVTRFVAPSVFCKEKLVENGWAPERIAVLPHFQEIPSEAEGESGEAYVAYAGRLSSEKGVEDLIRAMGLLPHVRLAIAGDGPERARLERLALTLGLTNTTFHGHLQRPDLYRFLRGSRFTVMPSRVYETFGKVILESFAVGRAVVASALGTRPELVSEGNTGMLYPAGDWRGLAATIDYLHARPDLSRTMGINAQLVVRRRYSAQHHVDALLGLYEEAMRG